MSGERLCSLDTYCSFDQYDHMAHLRVGVPVSHQYVSDRVSASETKSGKFEERASSYNRVQAQGAHLDNL